MGRPICSTAEIVPYTRDIINLVLRKGHKITETRADNGATFRSTAFATLCSEHNITQRFSAHYSTHQNALAERPWRTLAEMTRCLLFTAGLPQKYCELAFKHSVYLHNMTYKSRHGGIPLTLAT
jgi:transposase InsO family protein